MKVFIICLLIMVPIVLICLGISIAMQLVHTREFNESIVDLYNKHPEEASLQYGFLGGFIASTALKIQCRKEMKSEAKIEARLNVLAQELIDSGKADKEEIENVISKGGWICLTCGALNRGYVENCSCGRNKETNEEL